MEQNAQNIREKKLRENLQKRKGVKIIKNKKCYTLCLTTYNYHTFILFIIRTFQVVKTQTFILKDTTDAITTSG